MTTPQPLVAIAGSRTLAAYNAPIIAGVVAGVLSAGRGIITGCAHGADALAIAATLDHGAHPVVFAVRNSAAVVRAARAGAPVRFGTATDLPFATRLRNRSLAVVGAAARSGAGAGLVAFLARPHSPGTHLTIRAAHAAGLPVLVFVAQDATPADLPRLGRGRWQPAAQRGIWAAAYRFTN